MAGRCGAVRCSLAVLLDDGPITTTNYATNGTHLDVRRSADSAGPERRTTRPGQYD